MKTIVLISVICMQSMQLAWTYGESPSDGTYGIGAYASQDSTGNRYAGTYGIKNGQTYKIAGDDLPPNFGPTTFGPYSFGPEFGPDFGSNTFGPTPFSNQETEPFFEEYFRNFQNIITEHPGIKPKKIMILGEAQSLSKPVELRHIERTKSRIEYSGAFATNSENQRLALNAAKKALDLTSNGAGAGGYNYGNAYGSGFIPNMNTPLRDPNTWSYGFPMRNFELPEFSSDPFTQNIGVNSAFAGGSAGPGYRHQVVGINPRNPAMPNIDVKQFSEAAPKQGGGFYSVSSSSYASSNNVNGKEQNLRGGETVVNDNGKITKYSLHN